MAHSGLVKVEPRNEPRSMALSYITNVHINYVYMKTMILSIAQDKSYTFAIHYVSGNRISNKHYDI